MGRRVAGREGPSTASSTGSAPDAAADQRRHVGHRLGAADVTRLDDRVQHAVLRGNVLGRAADQVFEHLVPVHVHPTDLIEELSEDLVVTLDDLQRTLGHG